MNLLNWGNAAHWGRTEAPCRHCHQPTWLRDNERLPAHKTCAEEAAELEQTTTIHRYQKGRTR